MSPGFASSFISLRGPPDALDTGKAVSVSSINNPCDGSRRWCALLREIKEEAKPGDIRGAEHTVGVIPPAAASPPIIDPVDGQIDRDDSVALDTVAFPEGEGARGA
jgi:hypothetical protein